MRMTSPVWDTFAETSMADQFGRKRRTETKSAQEMTGEFLREIGVLVFVFFPIEAKVSNFDFPWWGYVIVESAAVICWSGGTLLEVKRKS
jgi:hypothetical protein